MLNFLLFAIQVTPPTATEVATDELLDKAERLIGLWDSLGPVMAILAVVTVALIVVGVVSYINRNSSATAIKVLEKVSDRLDKEIERQDKEIVLLQQQGSEDRGKYIESIAVVASQSTRANDLFEAMNNRSGQRDLQQQNLVESQSKIANDLNQMATLGSAPVQEIRLKVGEIVGIVTRIDAQTADWPGIVDIITPLLVELGELRTAAKKHKTQPIPQIDAPSGNGIVIEGTISGTVIEGDTQ